ncbi:MAG: glycyl radical protein [Eubacteriales bacterium]|nr:glycyl radical protein [Eubacteriales bacterium]
MMTWRAERFTLKKSRRIDELKAQLFTRLPQIEADRAVLLTESYQQSEGQPTVLRRAKAFAHILDHIPITIRPDELIVGSSTKAARSCQTFPEFSFEWLEAEFDTVATRAADPFEISEETKQALREVHRYWKGKTTSELATAYMAPETLLAMEHNIFTPGNYFYNGVGHVTVQYEKVLRLGYRGILQEVHEAKSRVGFEDPQYAEKMAFYQAMTLSLEAVIRYARRYAALAEKEAAECTAAVRRQELERIARNCSRVPEYPAEDFYQACQSFWFVQQLLQMESSGHSISPGRFDQYMYPYFKQDLEKGRLTLESAQELLDCIWIKLNDLNKCRDAASAEGFAGYSLFQNLIVGGTDTNGLDVTNELSFMCIEASKHVFLPQPSLSIRVWNGSPHELLRKAADLTRTGIGLPAYYNDEVIIPSLMSVGLTLEDARDYNIIGCVEPQKAGKTEGWHDAAFFNMCRPLELVFSNGMDAGRRIGPVTGEVTGMTDFEQFYDAYKTQMEYMIRLLVNANNAIDTAHAKLAPLPFESSMVEDCIGRGKSLQEGGAIYNFTGPQGFGIANMADSLYAIKKLTFEQKKVSLSEWKQALADNYGYGSMDQRRIKEAVLKAMELAGRSVDGQTGQLVERLVEEVLREQLPQAVKQKYEQLLTWIAELPKFGNDEREVDLLARDAAYTYTKPLLKYRNPRGGIFQAGLYPVSANVPLGAQTGATPDGRLAYTPVADGVSPSSGKDVKGPTAAANSVAMLDHGIASNGTLFNQKFHPSALSGDHGLDNFIALIRTYFDKKGSHMQFNVVSRETLLDAQQHPEKYGQLVVRVAGYSALFTTLSRSLQDDIIRRTEQGM